MVRREEQDVIGAANHGPLFDPPPVAMAHAPGAGQAARADARAKASAGSAEAYRRIALSLEGHGPQTRTELAETTGLKINTVNGRIAEMRDFAPRGEDPATWPFAVVTHGRRDGQSIVHLARLFIPSPEDHPHD